MPVACRTNNAMGNEEKNPRSFKLCEHFIVSTAWSGMEKVADTTIVYLATFLAASLYI